MVYVVPSGQEIKFSYVESLERAIVSLQAWFFGQMANGTTFKLNDPVVEVVRTQHSADWYRTNPSGPDPALWYFNNTTADAFSLTGAYYSDPANVWLFYNAANTGCGARTGANAHVGVLHAGDLRGLSGEPYLNECPGTPDDTFGLLRWVGGSGHELGHAFGLPHPPACEDNDPGTPCPSGALMYQGLYQYPNAYLLPEDRATLDSPFYPYSPPGAALPVGIRMFNIDDNAELFVNGVKFMGRGFGFDTGTVDVSPWLEPGANSIRFTLTNIAGGYTYGFNVYVNGQTHFHIQCGQAGAGCNNNDPTQGVVYDVTIPVNVPLDQGDSDADGVGNGLETACGSSSLNSNARPERTDGVFAANDDDGDELIDEPLPAGSETYDCDGDGWTGAQERLIYNNAPSTTKDQDPCGGYSGAPSVNDGWPADLVDSPPNPNVSELNIADFNSFVFPLRPNGSFNYFGHPVPDPNITGEERWNLDTAGPGAGQINIADLNALNPGVNAPTSRPPMFGGQPAFFTNVGNGVGGCPWPP